MHQEGGGEKWKIRDTAWTSNKQPSLPKIYVARDSFCELDKRKFYFSDN